MGEAAVSFLSNEAEWSTGPIAVDVDQSRSGDTLTTTTTNVEGVRTQSRSKEGLRLGMRVYNGPIDPQSPSNQSAEDKRVPATLLTVFTGFTFGFSDDWKIDVEGYGTRSSSSWILIHMDLMYTPITTVPPAGGSDRDDLLFPLGVRQVLNMGANNKLGMGMRMEYGMHGRGGGYYISMGFGVGGAAMRADG